MKEDDRTTKQQCRTIPLPLIGHATLWLDCNRAPPVLINRHYGQVFKHVGTQSRGGNRPSWAIWRSHCRGCDATYQQARFDYDTEEFAMFCEKCTKELDQ